MAQKILIVEDEEKIARFVELELLHEGYEAEKAFDGRTGLGKALSGGFDLVVLDVMLPGLNGLEVLRRIRKESDVPVIMLTARDAVMDKVSGLDAGADDYLTKPFSVDELLARLRVTQRRLALMKTDVTQESSIFTNGALKIDYAAGCAYLDDTELHLTPIEYKLLCLLSKNVGKVLTHTYITQQIWGSSWENDIASLRVFMATLRKKLERGKDGQQYIQTHIGIGYRMLRVE